MAVKIRLRRMGAKKKPFYRIVVADSRTARDGRFIEQIGYYDPTTNPPTMKVDAEKAKLWLGRGAQPSDTARSLLRRVGALGGGRAVLEPEPEPVPAPVPPAPVEEPAPAPKPRRRTKKEAAAGEEAAKPAQAARKPRAAPKRKAEAGAEAAAAAAPPAAGPAEENAQATAESGPETEASARGQAEEAAPAE